MDRIENNKAAWGQLSEEHYNTFKKRFINGEQYLNYYIIKELGDISNKDVIHLQCNTGADSILLAKNAKYVTGVDLVQENIKFAQKLAKDTGTRNVKFIASDIMKLSEVHKEKYDVVFTSEGVLGWLPDLNVWAKTIRKLLKDDGYLYIFDSHPFFLCFDENKLCKEEYDIKYPYFSKEPDEDDVIGGYASEAKEGVKSYFWMHTVSDIINSLINAGLHIEFFNEYPENYYNLGNMKTSDKNGLFELEYNKDKYPISFSLKASVYR